MSARIVLSKSEFAARIGVSKGRVSQYLRLGMPTVEGGQIDLEQALDWLGENVERTVESDGSTKPTLGMAELISAKVELARIAVERGRLELNRLQGMYYPHDDLMMSLTTFSREIRIAWENFGNRFGGQVAAEVGADPKLTMIAIERAVNAQLSEIARHEPTLPPKA